MIQLIINGEPFNIVNTTKLMLPSYQSAIKVESGGYSKSVARGTGYNQADKKVSFTVIVNSYTGELLEEFITRISSIFTWNPRRKYTLTREYNGNTYAMELTAPRYTIPEITNLRYAEVKVQFEALDNFFVDQSISSLPLILEPPSTSVELDFDSIIDVPINFKASIYMGVENDFPFLLRLGETNGNFIEINALIPKQYTGNNIINIDNQEASFGDYQLTPFMLGSLPVVSGKVSLFFDVNTAYSDAIIGFQRGLI